MKSARVHDVGVEEALGSMPDYRYELRRGGEVVDVGVVQQQEEAAQPLDAVRGARAAGLAVKRCLRQAVGL